MEENRNQKILNLETALLQYNEEVAILRREAQSLYEIRNSLTIELSNLEDNVDKSEVLARVSANDRSLFINERLLERKNELVRNTNDALAELLPNQIEKAKYNAWLKVQKIKPSVEEISEKAKRAVDDMKILFTEKFSKDNFSEAFDKVKENKHFQNTTEKAKIVKDELSELNLYKMIGQIKKNASDTLEDLSVYVKNNQIEEKVKGKVDKYVSPEVKGKVSTFFNKLKENLKDAAEIISDSEENETEAERREKLRRLKGVKENYVKSWVREKNVIVDNNVRSDIKDIHSNYLKFMKEEYGQEELSKLIINDYSEFVKVTAKYFNVPVIFNSDDGIINLKIR